MLGILASFVDHLAACKLSTLAFAAFIRNYATFMGENMSALAFAHSSYLERTHSFWKAFAKSKAALEKTVLSGNAAKIASVFSSLFKPLLPRVNYQVFYNKENKTFELAISPEGNKTVLFLAKYWKENAPNISNWIFHPMKPASADINSISLRIDGRSFAAKDLQLGLIVDVEKRNFLIHTYHPLFDLIDEQQRLQIAFLLIDEAIGESYAETWIGKILPTTSAPDPTINLLEMRPFMEKSISENGWNPDMTPDQIWYAYSSTKEPESKKDKVTPRRDVVAGSTSYPALSGAYPDKNLAEGTGADYAFLMIENPSLDIQENLANRAKYETEISDLLTQSKQGMLIGAATGLCYCYIDLLLLDGQKTIHLLKANFHEQHPNVKAKMCFFSNEKRIVEFQ